MLMIVQELVAQEAEEEDKIKIIQLVMEWLILVVEEGVLLVVSEVVELEGLAAQVL